MKCINKAEKHKQAKESFHSEVNNYKAFSEKKHPARLKTFYTL